jgi:hypothetical protein
VSTSKLFETYRNQTLDMEILCSIALMGSPNISRLTNVLGKDRNRVKSHLHKLKAHGYVKDRLVSVRTPFNRLISCHEYQLTRKGKRVLREGGLLFPTFRYDGSPPAWNPRVESGNDRTSQFLPPKGAPNSEDNYSRAAQAANVLHACSLAQRALKFHEGSIGPRLPTGSKIDALTRKGNRIRS